MFAWIRAYVNPYIIIFFCSVLCIFYRNNKGFMWSLSLVCGIFNQIWIGLRNYFHQYHIFMIHIISQLVTAYKTLQICLCRFLSFYLFFRNVYICGFKSRIGTNTRKENHTCVKSLETYIIDRKNNNRHLDTDDRVSLTMHLQCRLSISVWKLTCFWSSVNSEKTLWVT